jgi:small subunit ribosomal protein S3e
MPHPLSKKRKIVRDGVYFAELRTFLLRELAEDGFASVDHRVTPQRTEIVISATKTREIIGTNARRMRELTNLIAQRFKYKPGQLALFLDKVQNRGLCAMAQAESLRFKLVNQLPVRRAAMGIIRFVLESGGKGCEVIVSGKIRGQRGKTMKFRDGYLIKSGAGRRIFVDEACRHVYLRAGAIGIKVRIMQPIDADVASGGATRMLPDVITVLPPKETPTA